MKPIVVAAALAALSASSAWAELPIESRAPNFEVRAALAGKEFDFALEDALRDGPVILYFYPVALTGECLVQNYEFSTVAERINNWGASLIGISADPISTVSRSSELECSDKFPVGADPTAEVIKAFDVEDPDNPGRARSVAYLISPEGRIIFSHESRYRDPKFHVEAMVGALAMWRAEGGAQ